MPGCGALPFPKGCGGKGGGRGARVAVRTVARRTARRRAVERESGCEDGGEGGGGVGRGGEAVSWGCERVADIEVADESAKESVGASRTEENVL